MSHHSLTLLPHYLVKLTLVWMWTITAMLFTQRCKIQAKHDKRRWQKVDKVKTIINFKDYVRSVLPSHEHKLLSLAPLINSHVDSRLLKAAPNFNQPVLQFVDGVDFPLVYTTLMHASPDLVINWIEIWTVCRPQIWRNEVWCFSIQNLQFHANIHTSVSFTR